MEEADQFPHPRADRPQGWHWSGVLNLFVIALATSVVAYLYFESGWRWYSALFLWPVIYIGVPTAIGLVQGVIIRRAYGQAMRQIKP